MSQDNRSQEEVFTPRKRRLPHRDYALCCNNGQGWQEVTLLRDYTRREAMDEMAIYKGANPGSSFKLLVMEREDRE